MKNLACLALLLLFAWASCSDSTEHSHRKPTDEEVEYAEKLWRDKYSCTNEAAYGALYGEVQEVFDCPCSVEAENSSVCDSIGVPRFSAREDSIWVTAMAYIYAQEGSIIEAVFVCRGGTLYWVSGTIDGHGLVLPGKPIDPLKAIAWERATERR